MRTTHLDRAATLAETNPDLTFVGDGIAPATCWTLGADALPVLVPIPGGKRDTLTGPAHEMQAQAQAAHLMTREQGTGTPFFSNGGRFIGLGWPRTDDEWLVIPTDPTVLDRQWAPLCREDRAVIVSGGPDNHETRRKLGGGW